MKPKQKTNPNQTSVKIDNEHYRLVRDAANVGMRSVAMQLRIIFETYFNGGKP